MRPAITFSIAALAGAALVGAWAPQEAAADQGSHYGALAVDRFGVFAYGSSYDYPNRAGARQRALEECGRRGETCRIVLEFAGSGCASYHTVDDKDGAAWGWGTAGTRPEAQGRSQSECLARSGGAACGNHVWSCNSDDGGPIEILSVDRD